MNWVSYDTVDMVSFFKKFLDRNIDAFLKKIILNLIKKR